MKRINLFLIAAFVAASAVFVGCDKEEKMEPEVQSHDGKEIITLEDENGEVITEFVVVEDMPTFSKFKEIDFELVEKMMRSINEDMIRSLMESSLINNVVQPENAVEK